MRFLLDAHLSGRVVGKSLTRSGHEVRALDSGTEFEGLTDPEVLELAVSEGRILDRQYQGLRAHFERVGRRDEIAYRSDPGAIQRAE